MTVGGGGGPRTDDAAHADVLGRLEDAGAATWDQPPPAAAGGQPAGGELRLIPLVQWYDSTHVASTAYYRRFVFDRRARRVAKVR